MRFLRKFNRVLSGVTTFFLVAVSFVSLTGIVWVSPATAQGLFEFSDDFEAGIDASVWYLEHLQGVEWTHTTEGANGYIYAPPQQGKDWNNRCVDILTLKEDFSNFTFTWDMRFHTVGTHKDRRLVYFRSDDAAVPHGYNIHLGVGVPPHGHPQPNWLVITKYNPDGSSESVSPLVLYGWVLEQWYSFKLEACDNTFKLKVWQKGDSEPSVWLVEAEDTTTVIPTGRIGFGDYWECITDVDNVHAWTRVALDIKPRSCPNPLNVKIFEKEPPPNAKSLKGGVLPVAVLGCDVSQIDVSSLLLEGVAPLRHNYEDVSSPVQNGDECECTSAGSDGTMDLTLKFATRDIAAAIGAVYDGDEIALTLTGQMLDGTPFEASDCVRILSKRDAPPIIADPEDLVLGPAVPNPFNPVARISYVLPREGFVELSVYDVTGRLVENLVAQVQPVGMHVVEWNAKGMPSGIYLYRIKVGDFTETRKMILYK
jgi:hypothetical protein